MGAGQVTLTQHARVRMQQRGIRTRTLQALLENGRVRRAPGGCDLVILETRYAIVGPDGAIVTVGHRTRRLPRD